MRSSSRAIAPFTVSLPFLLLCLLMATLWLAGGASRGDALGQVVVRAAAALAMAIAILFGPRPSPAIPQPAMWLLGFAILLPLLQLISLPPAIWQMLPGRTLFVQAASVAGEAQPWRPVAIVPGGALNASASLIVPVAVLLLVSGAKASERALVQIGRASCRERV